MLSLAARKRSNMDRELQKTVWGRWGCAEAK